MNSRVNTFVPAALIAALALSAWTPPSLAAEATAADGKKQADVASTEKRLAEAQRELDVAARRVAELSSELGNRRGDQLFFFDSGGQLMPRAMIGIQLSSEEGQGGAKVVEVSPGGPAAEAGVKPGDIVTSIGGQDLTKESDPSRTMVEKMRDVDPKLKLQLGLLREGKKLSVDVTPRASQVLGFTRRVGPGGPGGPGGLGGPGVPGIAGGPGGPGAAGIATREFHVQVPGPMTGLPPLGRGERGERREFILNRGEEGGMGLRFHGIEFATLSERLGSYFGVKSGVLVVRAGSNPAFKLQDGDVILAIDGREPNSAQHAGRILRSYQPGEKLTIRVQRDRKAQNLEVTAPGGGED